jgi:hypothetical protein
MDCFDNFQSLRQEGERDCDVPVFGKLTGVSREEILGDLPEAAEGKVTVDQSENWLRSRNLDVTRHHGRDEHYAVPAPISCSLTHRTGYTRTRMGSLIRIPALSACRPTIPVCANGTAHMGARPRTSDVR